MGLLLELDETMQVKSGSYLLSQKRVHPPGENDIGLVSDAKMTFLMWCAHNHMENGANHPSSK